MLLEIFIYLNLVILIVFNIVIVLLIIEMIIRIKRNASVPVSSNRAIRKAVTDFMHKEFKNTSSVLDIGSGWGALVKAVSKKIPLADITGVELMLLPYIYSWLRVLCDKNINVKLGDVFKFLGKTNMVYDVGVSYLSVIDMGRLEKFKNRFKVIVSIDFPFPNIKYDKKIKLHKDYLGQHWMFLYKI